MFIQKLLGAVAALSLVALTASAGVASASIVSPPSPPLPASETLTFVPPSVGPLRVNIGPTIIGGQMIRPGVNVSTTEVTLPPTAWTLPAGWALPIGGAPVNCRRDVAEIS